MFPTKTSYENKISKDVPKHSFHAPLEFSLAQSLIDFFSLHLGLDEYSTICTYLGLPICLSKLFDIENERYLNNLINNWILNLSTSKSTIKYPILVNELHSLPSEYIDLMNKVSQG